MGVITLKKGLFIIFSLVLFLFACGDSDSITNKPNDVRNDTTGKWKKATTSESIDITEYALEYSKEHMQDNETHFIVNFTNNTTSVLNVLDGLLYVDVHERVEKEEHDAKTIGSGMLLKEYIIYEDGEIQEVGD